jgi:acetolactate synthase-1/2/3 large subunit
MGAGIPSAIGVSLASNKRVVMVGGDGSFSQCMQELEVIRRLNLNIIMFIIENGGYASIRSSEMRAFGRTAEGRTFPNINAVASAFGIMNQGMHDVGDVNFFLLRGGPQVVVVHTPLDEPIFPRVLFDGKGSLDNMFPYPEKK